MTNFELVQKLSDTAKISFTDAKNALEKTDWDLLEAMVYVEGQAAQAKQREEEKAKELAMEQLKAERVNLNKGIPSMNTDVRNSGATPNFNANPGMNTEPNNGFSPNNNFAQNNGFPHNNVNYPNSANCGTQPSYQTPFNSNYVNQNAQKPVEDIPIGEAAGKAVGTVGKVIHEGVSTGFVISKDDKIYAIIPIFIMIIMVVFAFWFTVPALIAGALLGFKYTIDGSKTIKETFNDGMDQLSKSTEKLREDFKRGMDEINK